MRCGVALYSRPPPAAATARSRRGGSCRYQRRRGGSSGSRRHHIGPQQARHRCARLTRCFVTSSARSRRRAHRCPATDEVDLTRTSTRAARPRAPNRRRQNRSAHGHRCRTHHRRARAARLLPRRLHGRRPKARRAAGCLDFAITADLLDPARINIFERWESQAAVETFRGSGPSDGQSAAMASASVAEYDIADVRSLTGNDTA